MANVLGNKILCSECLRNGYPPTFLGVVEKAEGTLRLWCKRCKAEIRVEIHDGHIKTAYADNQNTRHK